jgi:ribosomal protein L6P/L9E
MVVGTSVGFTKVLQLVGVGYRAAVADGSITLSLGYSHPVVIEIPKGLTVTVSARAGQPLQDLVYVSAAVALCHRPQGLSPTLGRGFGSRACVGSWVIGLGRVLGPCFV